MRRKYEWPSRITPQAIKEEFLNASEVSFSARQINYLPYQYITFGDLFWWIPLTHALPIVGVTPTMLRPIFNPQRKIEWREDLVEVKKSFPHNFFERVKLIDKEYMRKISCKTREIELPKLIKTYDDLGEFPLKEKHFKKMAEILGKSVRVCMEDGTTGHHHLLFIAHPSGEIVEAKSV